MNPLRQVKTARKEIEPEPVDTKRSAPSSSSAKTEGNTDVFKKLDEVLTAVNNIPIHKASMGASSKSNSDFSLKDIEQIIMKLMPNPGASSSSEKCSPEDNLKKCTNARVVEVEKLCAPYITFASHYSILKSYKGLATQIDKAKETLVAHAEHLSKIIEGASGPNKAKMTNLVKQYGKDAETIYGFYTNEEGSPSVFQLMQNQKPIVENYKNEFNKIISDASGRLLFFENAASIKGNIEQLKQICAAKECFDSSELIPSVCGAINYCDTAEIT